MSDIRLEERYGGFFLHRTKLRLSEENVPPNLRPYVEWAAFWGVSDDFDREALLKEAPEEAIDDLRETIARIDNDLNDWLAGPDANDSSPTEEYVAFSAMRIASF